jgi:PcfK-like protein
MKSTEAFKKTIQKYLEDRANTDALFAETFRKEGKNIDDCVTYILNTVQKSGCNGFADDEIYSMAVHYYDEDKIEIGGHRSGNVIVNHKVELSEEEKKIALEKARKEYQEIQLREFQQSQERKDAREKKKQDKLKAQEAERKAKRIEIDKKLVMSQQTLF